MYVAQKCAAVSGQSKCITTSASDSSKRYDALGGSILTFASRLNSVSRGIVYAPAISVDDWRIPRGNRSILFHGRIIP
jgi:hypothetical protein